MTNTNNYHHNNPGDPTTTTTTTTTAATTNVCLLPAAEPQPPQRPRSAREEVAHTVSAMISFHCIICFDEFNATTRTPMVLPCGHTYVCLPCTKRLKRCMECRQSLFLPNNNHPNNNNNNQNQNQNNNNNNHPFDQNSSYPFSNSRAQFRNHNNNNATNNPSGGVRGGGFPNRRYYGVGQPPPPQSAPAQPSEPIPLPIPKNVVLLSMIEATLEQQSRWKPPPQESPDHHHHHTATRKILRGGGGGGVGDSSSPPPHHHHKRTSSVPQEVELTIGGGIQGPNGEDEDLSANSSASDQEVLSTATHPEDEQDHDENDVDGDGGHNENNRSSRNIAKEEDDEEENEEEEEESFQMDRIVKSIETLLAGSCGTYAVREKEGLVVLPKDPRKNRQQLQERLQQEHEKLRRQQQQQQQRRRHHHDSSSGALSSCSSSGQSSSEAASSSLNRFDAAAAGGGAAGVGGGSGSTTAKDLASLRLRKRQLEHRILHQRRSSSSASSLESLTKSSSYYCSPKLGAAAAAAGTARDDHQSVNSASPEEEESRCSNSIAKKRTSPPSLPAPRAHARVDSNSSIISIRKRLHDVRMKNNKLMIILGESPEQQQQGQEGQEHPKQEQSRGRSPPVTKNRRSSHGPTSPSSMSNLTLSPASSSNVARPKSPVVTATLKEPFRIKYGQKVQAVSFVDGVVTLARNQGFILATPSQLVKVGPPADDSCRLEGLLETVSLEGRELEAKLKTNHSICLALMKKIQMAQAAPAKHPIVTELPRESPEGSTTATPDQAGPKGRDDLHSHHDGATVVDDSNSLMQTGSVDPTDTGPAPAPKTPPTQLMQPSLRTPTAPNRAHPTTSIGEPCRGYRGGLTSSSSTNSSHGSSRVPDTPKTIDNSDLDHQHVRRRQNNRRPSGGGGGILGLAQSLSRASTNPRSNRRSTSVTESDHMDLIFGCGTSLLSTTECLSHAADDPVSRDLFLPSPRSTGGSMYHDEDDDEDGNNNNNNNNNNDENGTTQTPHPYQPQQQQHPTTPSTPRSPAILASSAGRYIRTPESVASTSTLTPVLQPISSFDSAINFRTGFSGHNGLTVTSIKKNKVYHSPPLSAHNQPQLGYGHHSYGTSQQQQQQHQHQLQHSQQQQQQQRRPRIRMMGEHRGLGLRLDVRQAMSSWGITTSQNTS